jgi:hypothetical protein
VNAVLPNGTETLAAGILRLLNDLAALSELESAKALVVGGGRAEFSVCALLGKAILKLQNCRIGLRTSTYLCVLRPKGERVEHQIVRKCMQIKTAKYGALRSEMAQLQHDTDHIGSVL